MKLSIVIPALNEENTIGIVVDKAILAIDKLGLEAEVVVSDNGSTDATCRIARAKGARVVCEPIRGYGSALSSGFTSARGEYILMADADDSYDIGEIKPYIDKLNEGYDFVMGNRFKGKIEKGAMPFLHRYLGTPVLAKIMNTLFRTQLGDPNCGMRALTKDAFNKMRLKAVGMEFATEMIVKASLRKMKIAEVPCNLYNDKRGHGSHLKTWQDGWHHLRFMLLFTPNWFLIPGLVLTVIGLSGLLVLLSRDIFTPWALSFITQKHMLSFMLFFFTGIQITGLGLAYQAFNFSEYFDQKNKIALFLLRYFKLEKGALFGFFLLLLGVCLFLYLLISWYTGVLPHLTDLVRLDIAIIAITSFLTGIQFICLSFLLGVVYLKVK